MSVTHSPEFSMRTVLIALALLFFTSFAAAQSAPPLTLSNDRGDTVQLPREHEGVDIYLFWASWCPYCKAFMPHLQSILDEYGDEVSVFALQIRDEEDGRAFLDENGFEFELIPNADSAMAPYGVRTTPGLFLVDGSGELQFDLNDIVLVDPPGYEDLGNRGKAARRAPAWAAQVRQEIDRVLDQR